MVKVDPDDFVDVMVHNHCDILVPFFIARFIYSNVDESIEPLLDIGLKLIQGPLYAASYGLVVDTEEVTHKVLGQVLREPSDCQVKTLRETAPWE